jgi:hypothetical protein
VIAPVLALTEVFPCAAVVLTATEAGLIVPTASVSLASTATVTAWFSGVTALSATAVGDASTVTVTVAAAERAPAVSATVYWNVSVPKYPKVGV